MKTILKNANILDGTLNMQLQENKDIFIEDGIIKEIAKDIQVEGAKVIDLNGKYVTPGLINLHVHLPASGKVSKKKLGDKTKLVKLLTSNALMRYICVLITESSAKKQLLSGTTTIRSVGGVGNADSRVRDYINSGKFVGPRILTSNCAIGPVGGHMVGTVAKAVNDIAEAELEVERLHAQHVDLIKVMITGGILDCKEIGHPGELKMQPEMVKAICDKAHSLGLKVAAHVEGPEGMEVAINNGVDTIEHGANVDEELLKKFRDRNGSVVLTLSPAIPFVYLNPDVTGYGSVAQINSISLLSGMVNTAKECIKMGCNLGIGNDTGCPFVTQYDTYREMIYFVKLVGVTPSFALHSMTLNNAKILGISDITGSVEVNKSADLVVLDSNPLEDLRAFANPNMVVFKGKTYKKKIKKDKYVESVLNELSI